MSLIPFMVTKNSVLVLNNDTHVLLVKAGGINLPIGISQHDAQCIMSLVDDGEFEKDSPFDLEANILTALGASLDRIAITELSDDSFLAKIYLKRGREEFSLTAFPGDAIIMALGLKTMMFIEEDVLVEGSSADGTQAFLSKVQRIVPHALEV